MSKDKSWYQVIERLYKFRGFEVVNNQVISNHLALKDYEVNEYVKISNIPVERIRKAIQDKATKRKDEEYGIGLRVNDKSTSNRKVRQSVTGLGTVEMGTSQN